MDPRYRAVLVMSLLLIALWGGQVAWTYLMGSGVNLDRYLHGLILVGGSTIAGFLLVAAAMKVISLQRVLKTGFEADVVDEFGTGFEMSGPEGKPQPFKLSLSKFLPQLIAPPSWPNLHPLEAELFGFLHGFRHWPLDITQQNQQPFTSLYEQAMARWQVMRHLPGSNEWHRIAALAKDLALVYAYREDRTEYPLREFWKRDRVKFSQRCVPHGGLAAFVLSTFPAARALTATPDGQIVQRALLAAIRYQNSPTHMPLNAPPLARELVDYLWRADAQLQQLDVREMDQVGPEQWQELRNAITGQWLTVLTSLEVNATPGAEMTTLKLADGSIWLKQQHLLAILAPQLPPAMRQLLRLWDTTGGIQHPCWPHVAPTLLDAKLIEDTYEGQAASNGCFTLTLARNDTTLTWGPAVRLHIDPQQYTAIARKWQSVAGWEGLVETVMDVNQMTVHAQTMAGQLDDRLAEML